MATRLQTSSIILNFGTQSRKPNHIYTLHSAQRHLAKCRQYSEIYKYRVTAHTTTSDLAKTQARACRWKICLTRSCNNPQTHSHTVPSASYARFAACCCITLRGLRNNSMCGSIQSKHTTDVSEHQKHISNAIQALGTLKQFNTQKGTNV